MSYYWSDGWGRYLISSFLQAARFLRTVDCEFTFLSRIKSLMPREVNAACTSLPISLQESPYWLECSVVQIVLRGVGCCVEVGYLQTPSTDSTNSLKLAHMHARLT